MAQTFNFSSKYIPSNEEYGFAYRAEARVTVTKSDNYGKTFSVKLLSVTMDESGYYSYGKFYNRLEYPDLFTNINPKSFYLVQIGLNFDCKVSGSSIFDFNFITEENDNYSVRNTATCKVYNPNGIKVKVITDLEVAKAINLKISRLGTSKSSSNNSSSQASSGKSSLTYETPVPTFSNKSIQQLTQERDDAVVNLVKTTVNTLDFFLSEARENSIRKAQQRQIEYQRAEEERLKREAEEYVNKKNAKNDIEYYLAKAEAGDDFAMEKVASAYLTLKNEDKATIWYEKATNSGSAKACSMLMYLKENKNSDLDKRHTAESLKWLPRQIELGDFSIAMLNISISYGSKSSKWYDPKKAITLYKQLAELGCAEAMFKLGETLTGGNKYEINEKKNFDVEEGIKWLKLCSEFEDSKWSPKALEEISEIYTEGRLIKKNKEKADEYALAAKELQEKLGYVFYMYAIITSEDNGFAIVTKLLTCHSRTGEYGRSSTDEARIAESRFADYIKNKKWEEFINNTKFNYSIEMINWSNQYDINKKRLEDVRKRVSSGQKVVIKEVDFSYNKRQK